MASNDLTRLYKSKTVIENYYAVERSNEGFTKSASNECSVVTADETVKIAKLNEKNRKNGKLVVLYKTRHYHYSRRRASSCAFSDRLALFP